jgi:hypothetical protein
VSSIPRRSRGCQGRLPHIPLAQEHPRAAANHTDPSAPLASCHIANDPREPLGPSDTADQIALDQKRSATSLHHCCVYHGYFSLVPTTLNLGYSDGFLPISEPRYWRLRTPIPALQSPWPVSSFRSGGDVTPRCFPDRVSHCFVLFRGYNLDEEPSRSAVRPDIREALGPASRNAWPFLADGKCKAVPRREGYLLEYISTLHADRKEVPRYPQRSISITQFAAPNRTSGLLSLIGFRLVPYSYHIRGQKTPIKQPFIIFLADSQLPISSSTHQVKE